MANKKAAKKAAKKTTKRVAVDWVKIQRMWDAGKSYLEIAKATDPHFNPKSADATKPTRAKISNALRLGVRINGELVKFKPRVGMRNLGVGKLMHQKASKKAAVKKTAVKTYPVKMNGKVHHVTVPDAETTTAKKGAN